MSDEQEDAQPTEEFGGNALKVLEKAIEDIERLEAEKAALLEDIKSRYAAAAADGIDKKALKHIIKERKADLEKTVTLRGITETYRRALATVQGELGDWARTFRSRVAKVDIDKAKAGYADPNLDALLKGRTQRTGDRDEGEARS